MSIALAVISSGTCSNKYKTLSFEEWGITVYFIICSVIWGAVSIIDREKDLKQDEIDDRELIEE